MSCENILRDQLRASGLRMTPQREIVLSVMHDLHEPETAEALFQRVQSHSSVIDISTVYRTLDLLQKLNLVTVIDIPNENKRFALNGQHGPHAHLVCRCCGHVMAVPADTIQALAQSIRTSTDFAIDVSELTISGLCSHCQGANQHAHS